MHFGENFIVRSEIIEATFCQNQQIFVPQRTFLSPIFNRIVSHIHTHSTITDSGLDVLKACKAYTIYICASIVRLLDNNNNNSEVTLKLTTMSQDINSARVSVLCLFHLTHKLCICGNYYYYYYYDASQDEKSEQGNSFQQIHTRTVLCL